MQQFQAEADEVDDGFRYRFPLGVVPQEIKELSAGLTVSVGRLAAEVEQFEATLNDMVEDASGETRDQAEHWLSAVASMVARLDSCHGLWASYARPDDATPYARWVSVLRSPSNIQKLTQQFSTTPSGT